MNLEPQPRNLDGVREMKVKIPVRLHISLHGLKLLSGRPLSDIVTEALQGYVAAHAAQAAQRTPWDGEGLEMTSGPAAEP
jgi:hypothetical protein